MKILFAFLSIALATISIPLHRATSSESVIKQALSSLSSPPRKLWSYSNITNYKNNQYYIQASIGTPPQTFTFLINTGSSYTWIDGADCLDCHNGSKFNAKSSSTYQNTTKTQFISSMSGSLNCSLGTDIISIGSSDSLVATGQPFYLTYSGSWYSEFKADGAIGFAPNLLEGEMSSLISTLKSEGIIQHRQFALYLNGKNTYSDLPDHDSSNIMIDGFDLEKYSIESSFHYINLYVSDELWEEDKGLWEIDFYYMSFGDEIEYSTKTTAIIDTSISSIIGPYSMIRDILYSTCLKSINDCFCLCNSSYPDLFIYMGDCKFTMRPSDYLIPLGEGYCKPAFDWLSGIDYWILGDIFVRKFYINFDIDGRRIGFAEIEADTLRETPSVFEDSDSGYNGSSGSYSSHMDEVGFPTWAIVLLSVLPGLIGLGCSFFMCVIFKNINRNLREQIIYRNTASVNRPSVTEQAINENLNQERKSIEGKNLDKNNNFTDGTNENGSNPIEGGIMMGAIE